MASEVEVRCLLEATLSQVTVLAVCGTSDPTDAILLVEILSDGLLLGRDELHTIFGDDDRCSATLKLVGC